jgi:DNA uptake protein ComE-like DNA-binding protein
VVKIIASFVVISFLLVTGCTSQKPSPDEVREKTAEATSDIKRDAQALAQGVREGWNRDQPLDVNKATKEQLLSLPGINSERANRIIAARPYSSPSELVSRRAISQPEYENIKDRVTAKD